MATLPVILVAVDGSNQCMDTITYISRILSPNQINIELFHVKTEAPEAVFDLGGAEGFSTYEAEISNWNSLYGTQIQDFMDKARKVLTDAGFPPDAVNATIRSKKIGIARDIIDESELGCSAVVIGPKGFDTLPDFMMGSIAAKLAESITHVPLVIVGSQPEPHKVLVAFDRSRRIRKGFDKVSRLFSKSLEEILLCHIIRPLSVPHPVTCTYFTTRTEAHWLDEHSRRITSRAGAIARDADTRGFGTIVVGRRGTTAVEGFTMGRVTRKILSLAFNKAIWIV
ncbi:MAG: universal stress protein [Desulfosarcina sp.]|nr:universal stress protein [Desulfosarcina sp.]